MRSAVVWLAILSRSAALPPPPSSCGRPQTVAVVRSSPRRVELVFACAWLLWLMKDHLALCLCVHLSRSPQKAWAWTRGTSLFMRNLLFFFFSFLCIHNPAVYINPYDRTCCGIWQDRNTILLLLLLLLLLGRIACTLCMRTVAADVARSGGVVCVSVCLAHMGELCMQKRLNRSRCRLKAESYGSIEPCIRWGSRSDESICSRGPRGVKSWRCGFLPNYSINTCY